MLTLREAFHDDSAADDVYSITNPWDSDPNPPSSTEVLAELARSTHRIRRSASPRAYWPQRHRQRAPGSHQNVPGARLAFTGLVAELESSGYLDRVFPRLCVDDHRDIESDRAAELAKRLGVTGLWPFVPDEWNDDTFYGLIEVYHDLLARPRRRTYHDHADCGWHYSEFSVTAGREVYRWRVNELLEVADIDYRLAESGEDQGRLIASFDNGRSTLVANAHDHSQPNTVERVDHAVALFRRRGATPEDKRSAVIALAGILEERRKLIKAELGSADEGALFQIANNFAIRHQNNQQRGDYDLAFLDWFFWWYLGTVEPRAFQDHLTC